MEICIYKSVPQCYTGLSVQCSVFSVQCSVFSVQCSVFGVQRESAAESVRRRPWRNLGRTVRKGGAMQSRYVQIAERIRGEIASGQYSSGARIPAENELARMLDVSRPTVRQALDLLAREGLLVRVKGSGTFVSQSKLVHESTSFVTGYREESRRKNRILRTKVVCLRTQEAGEKVGDALKLAPEEPVTKLVRIRHLENMYANAPVVYTTLYVPVKLFPDMARTDFTETSFYEALDSRGLSVAHASRRLEVVMPPEEVAAGLEITAFEPVAFIVSRGYTGSGQAVEYTESYYPASRSSFRIEIDR